MATTSISCTALALSSIQFRVQFAELTAYFLALQNWRTGCGRQQAAGALPSTVE
jgi:hypothetical protein